MKLTFTSNSFAHMPVVGSPVVHSPVVDSTVQSSSRRADSVAVSNPVRTFLRLNWAVIIAIVVVFVTPLLVTAQSSAPRLVTQAIDESQLTPLRGNTHPLARAEFDRGAAPASLAMDHMILVLKRSAAQESALETLLAQQQDKSSPNYHQWLTAQQFGQQFGPADADIQAITSWLQSHGFQNVIVSNGKTTVDFSGTAGNVQSAFHTAIHQYVLTNGEQHWANSTDPQIPTALSTVVAGVNSLNNFRKKPAHRTRGLVRKNVATGKFTALNPAVTFQDGCNGTGTNCFGVGPGDFDIIYNVPSAITSVQPSITGAGQTIAIVSDSDIHASDVTQFRSIFGLPAITFNQIETDPAADPGVLFDGGNGDEIEAVLDVEWSGAVAPSATIDLVVSPTTFATQGQDTSAEYVINGKITPLPGIISFSYISCELANGTSGNQFFNAEWQQAAAEGITVVVAAGDSGSAGCDASDSDTVAPAEYGLQVNGIASTPYNVAVGGTDFNDPENPTAYWNNIPGALNSALGYIPEMAYNDSCVNPTIWSTFLGFTSTELACNNAEVQEEYPFIVAPNGGGGGVSNCTTNNGATPSSCAGGYPKPTWQVGTGVPADGLRDLPDISLFAGDGTIQNFYIDCEADLEALYAETTVESACNLAYPYEDFVEVGGTSVSAQAFAGIVALIDQKQGGLQGNINPLLYALASESSPSSIFHDVTVGNNAQPCVTAITSAGCTVSTGFSIGILNEYSAGTGYDQATGLGSLNVNNLVNNAGPNFYLSSTSSTVTIASPGASGALTLKLTSVNGFSGNVSLACSGLPTGATCTFSPTSATLTAGTPAAPGTASITVTVNTTTASFTPSSRPSGNNILNGGRGIRLVVVFLIGALILSLRKGQRRFGRVPAFLAFGLLLAAAGCGSSAPPATSTTTPTGPSANTATITATSGNISSQMSFTVNIQ